MHAGTACRSRRDSGHAILTEQRGAPPAAECASSVGEVQLLRPRFAPCRGSLADGSLRAACRSGVAAPIRVLVRDRCTCGARVRSQSMQLHAVRYLHGARHRSPSRSARSAPSATRLLTADAGAAVAAVDIRAGGGAEERARVARSPRRCRGKAGATQRRPSSSRTRSRQTASTTRRACAPPVSFWRDSPSRCVVCVPRPRAVILDRCSCRCAGGPAARAAGVELPASSPARHPCSRACDLVPPCSRALATSRVSCQSYLTLDARRRTAGYT